MNAVIAAPLVAALLLAFVDCDPLPAHAGAERVLVPLSTCTSTVYLRVGESHGCEGWTEARQPRCTAIVCTDAWVYACSGLCDGMGPERVHWNEGWLDADVVGAWGYGRRLADGRMRWVRMTP